MCDRASASFPIGLSGAGGRRIGRGRPRQAIEPDRRIHFSIRCMLCVPRPRGLHEIGDVPKSPVPVLTALVHVSGDKSDMRGIKTGWSPS